MRTRGGPVPKGWARTYERRVARLVNNVLFALDMSALSCTARAIGHAAHGSFRCMA